MDLREYLKTGVFGITDKGERFVVVGHKIIYQHGGWDLIKDLDSDLKFFRRNIEVLFDATSFDDLNCMFTELRHKAIYDRRLPKFKVGDVIELTRDYYGIPKGARGEVISNMTEDAPNHYGIDFKMRYPQTHTCANRLSKRTGVFAPEEVLKKAN